MELQKYSGDKESEGRHILLNKGEREILDIIKKRDLMHGRHDLGIQAHPKSRVGRAMAGPTKGRYFGRLIGEENQIGKLPDILNRHLKQLAIQADPTPEGFAKLTEHNMQRGPFADALKRISSHKKRATMRFKEILPDDPEMEGMPKDYEQEYEDYMSDVHERVSGIKAGKKTIVRPDPLHPRFSQDADDKKQIQHLLKSDKDQTSFAIPSSDEEALQNPLLSPSDIGNAAKMGVAAFKGASIGGMAFLGMFKGFNSGGSRLPIDALRKTSPDMAKHSEDIVRADHLEHVGVVNDLAKNFGGEFTDHDLGHKVRSTRKGLKSLQDSLLRDLRLPNN